MGLYLLSVQARPVGVDTLELCLASQLCAHLHFVCYPVGSQQSLSRCRNIDMRPNSMSYHAHDHILTNNSGSRTLFCSTP